MNGKNVLPRIVLIKQTPPLEKLDNIKNEAYRAIQQTVSSALSFSNLTVGITAGSRGIHAINDILTAIVEFIKARGGLPVVLPAMGSHGGATAEGQRELLAGLGITENATGAPIADGVKAKFIGTTPSGIPVYCNKNALEADRLIVINRIKPHTDFYGPVESGLCKMLAIGLGSHKGAMEIHHHALRKGYSETIIEVAKYMLEKLPVVLAVGIIENWKGETLTIEAVDPKNLIAHEKILCAQAKNLMIKLPFEKIDSLIVQEIGKEISGTGMDTKVIGRIMIIGQKEPKTPKIKRIAVLNLTQKSEGNALGIGLADYTTSKVYRNYNPHLTAVNAVASMGPEQAKLPCVMQNDREAIRATLITQGLADPTQARMVIIRNTARLEYLYISEALLAEAKKIDYVDIMGTPKNLTFDQNGNITGLHFP